MFEMCGFVYLVVKESSLQKPPFGCLESWDWPKFSGGSAPRPPKFFFSSVLLLVPRNLLDSRSLKYYFKISFFGCIKNYETRNLKFQVQA